MAIYHSMHLCGFVEGSICILSFTRIFTRTPSHKLETQPVCSFPPSMLPSCSLLFALIVFQIKEIFHASFIIMFSDNLAIFLENIIIKGIFHIFFSKASLSHDAIDFTRPPENVNKPWMKKPACLLSTFFRCHFLWQFARCMLILQKSTTCLSTVSYSWSCWSTAERNHISFLRTGVFFVPRKRAFIHSPLSVRRVGCLIFNSYAFDSGYTAKLINTHKSL